MKSRYIVVPVLTNGGIAYYVKDIPNDTVVSGGYGCELWANHRAKELNDEVGHGNDKEGEQDMR